MKKGIFKLMSAAVVATALVSCTDDLGFSNGKQQKADLVATIEDAAPVTRMGMLEYGTAPWEDKTTSPWGVAWTEGDHVRVFTVEQLTYNYYELNEGSENKLEGEFTLKNVESQLVGDKKYAITDAQFVYGVSATADGEARLTYTIPWRYKAVTIPTTVDGQEANVRKFPAPYWGLASENGGNITVGTKAMTAFLRVDMNTLPAGTKYIVLTTHGNRLAIKNEAGADVLDGFHLADPAAGFSTANDKLQWWEDNAQFITDGKSEPLSGTFNTILKTGCTLGVDEGLEDDEDGWYSNVEGISRLVTRDEIIVELTANTPAVFYVPIICEKYENLHVIAASALSKYAYKYVGTEVWNYHQKDFTRGLFVFLSMNIENLGNVCPRQLNEAIARVNDRADRISILNVDKLIKCTGAGVHDHGTTYNNKWAANKINVSGTGMLTLNIKAIEDGEGKALANATGAVVTDQKTAGMPALYVTTAKAAPSTEIKDKVIINLPQQLGVDQTVADKPALLSNLPAYNVFIGSVNGKDLTNWTAFVKGSKTKCVTGHNTLLNSDNETLKDAKDAGINVVTGLKALNVLDGTTGDVFVNQIANEEPEILDLNILSDNQIDIRITNGLVKSLNFTGRQPSAEAYVFTTGSSAIQFVKSISAVSENNEPTIDDANPSLVSLYSYWTGAALSNKARLANSETNAAGTTYDTGTIYTVAQLASVGEMDQADYHIPHLLVKDMWLGAQEHHWIGAQAKKKGFHLDGENVPLRKMSFRDHTTKDGTGPYYVDDPHMCCTTCGWVPAVYANGTIGGDVTELNGLGLIRSFKDGNDLEAIIENVNLSDVYFDTELVIGQIGAIIGTVQNAGAFTMRNNSVTSPQFNVAGQYIGGLAGAILAKGVTLENNTILDTDEEPGYIKSSKDYIGGLVGQLKDYGKTKINHNLFDIDGNIEGSARVGGIGGRLDLKDESEIIANEVKVEDILATYSYAGGIAGAIEAEKKLVFGKVANDERETETVIADNIKAGENFAGGFAGEMAGKDVVWVCEAVVDVDEELSAGEQFAGGLFGSAKANRIINRSADIDINTLKAVDGFAGGEIGYVDHGEIVIGCASAQYGTDLATDIDITTMSGAYAIGGVVGGNTINATLNLSTLKSGTETEPANNTISIEVAGWENPKATDPGFDTYFGVDPEGNGADSKSHKAGTISNVIGYLVGDMNITAVKGFDGEELFDVTDNLDKDAKEAVGYKYHTDEMGNIPTGKAYWGDTHGYVGYGNAGYFINGKAVISQRPDGFNLFKAEENYD